MLIGDELDEQLKLYVRELRARRAGIDTTVLITCGEAIVSRVDKKLLKVRGRLIDLSKSWAKSLLGRMGYVKRKVNTTVKVELSHFEELKAQYLLDIKAAAVQIAKIQMDLVMNLDHTGVNIVPGSYWIFEEKGAKRVECEGLDDKHQITVMISATASGIFLPFQVFFKFIYLLLIYQGKTPACLPLSR